MRNIFRSLVPRKIRRTLKDLAGVTDLQERVAQLEELLFELRDELWEKSRKRWRESNPDALLTWGRELSGDGFILKTVSYRAFGHEKTVLEVGPGYGRLLKSMIEQRVPFKKYVAVDIGEKHIEHLKEMFPESNIHFVHGDVETISLDDSFDVVLSSLTLKHLFPTFENALRNIANYMNPGGMLFFDLIEGESKRFEEGARSSLRQYTKTEILAILQRAALELVAFDEVLHDPDHSRLLVVARKSKNIPPNGQEDS